MIQTLKKNSLFLKNGMRNLINFNLSSEKSENVHFDGIFLSKVCNVWVKLNRRVVSWTMTHGFKNDKEFGEFLHKQLKVLLDKSSVFNILAAKNCNFWTIVAQMYSTTCLKLSKFLIWFLKPVVSFCIYFAPFCNNLARA